MECDDVGVLQLLQQAGLSEAQEIIFINLLTIYLLSGQFYIMIPILLCKMFLSSGLFLGLYYFNHLPDGGKGCALLLLPDGGEGCTLLLLLPHGGEGGTILLLLPDGGKGCTLLLLLPDGGKGCALHLLLPNGGEGCALLLLQPDLLKRDDLLGQVAVPWTKGTHL